MRYGEVEQIGGRIRNMRRKGRRGRGGVVRSEYGASEGRRGRRLLICIVT